MREPITPEEEQLITNILVKDENDSKEAKESKSNEIQPITNDTEQAIQLAVEKIDSSLAKTLLNSMTELRNLDTS